MGLLPEISPLGLTLEFDILWPSGILTAFTMPPPSKAELNTLHVQSQKMSWSVVHFLWPGFLLIKTVWDSCTLHNGARVRGERPKS